jgi:hypothetical protein
MCFSASTGIRDWRRAVLRGGLQIAGSKTFGKLFISPHHRDWARGEPLQRRASVNCTPRFDPYDIKAPDLDLSNRQRQCEPKQTAWPGVLSAQMHAP